MDFVMSNVQGARRTSAALLLARNVDPCRMTRQQVNT
jgi:hypothetical protein